MTAIRYKAFVGPIMYAGPPLSLDCYREDIRDRAEQYVNGVIGAENVVSITEHGLPYGPLSVVIWYRDVGQMAKELADVDDLLV